MSAVIRALAKLADHLCWIAFMVLTIVSYWQRDLEKATFCAAMALWFKPNKPH